MIEMVLQRSLIYMELSFTDVAFMLFVRVIDLRTDVVTLGSKDRHHICEKKSVIEHLKFGSLDLLDVAIKARILPF